MAVGSLGQKIIFEVSDKKILTFKDLKKTVSGKWQKHEIILNKAKQEFLGPELQSLTFSINVNAALGVKPNEVITEIENVIETGQPQTFILGGKPMGNDLWVITSMTEAWNTVLNGGQLLSASLDLSLEEYLGENYYG